MLNRGAPGEVTYPPLRWEDDPKQLPRDNLLWRECIRRLIYNADPNFPDYREGIHKDDRVTFKRLIFRQCSLDPIFFTAGFGTGINPRLSSHLMIRPFIPWPDQIEVLTKLSNAISAEDPECDVVWPKGRDEGATFLAGHECIRRWLFLDESFFWVTRTLDLIDNRKPDSVFGKLRFILYALPAWMLPHGWQAASQAGYDKLASLTKPSWQEDRYAKRGGYFKASGPSIDGYASTGEAAVGRRYKGGFFDEFGAIGEDKPGEDYKLWIRAGPSVSCRIGLGTPRGKHTQHSALIRRAKIEMAEPSSSEERQLVYIFLNWKGNPHKNKPLFRMKVRPSQYRDDVDYYGILLRLYQLERDLEIREAVDLIAGKMVPQNKATEEMRRKHSILIEKCRPVDPVKERREWKREFSPWYLAECKDMAQTAEGRKHILTDVDGVEYDDASYFFSSDRLQSQPTCDPKEVGDFDKILEDVRIARFDPSLPGQLYVWQKPEIGHIYGMTSDAGHGQGGDYSVIAVWDVTDWPVKLVAMFRDNRTGPERLALYAIALHRWYCYRPAENVDSPFGAFWCPEANAEARSTISRAILELNYPRHMIYVRGKLPEIENEDDLGKYGWKSAFKNNRELIFTQLREQLEDAENIEIASSIMVNELESIRSEDFQPDDQEGLVNDDCAVNAALVPQMLRGFNQAIRGVAIFDVLGPWMRSKMQHQIELTEAHKNRFAKRKTANRDKNIAIWKAA